MEDDLKCFTYERQHKCLENGRQLHYLANTIRPQYLNKWKTTTKFSQMEDDLHSWKLEENFIIWQIEDDLNIFTNGRRPQYFHIWKTTLIFFPMAYDINILAIGEQPQILFKEI